MPKHGAVVAEDKRPPVQIDPRGRGLAQYVADEQPEPAAPATAEAQTADKEGEQ